MNARQHYEEVERLLARTVENVTYDEIDRWTAQAQVDATLALAAASQSLVTS